MLFVMNRTSFRCCMPAHLFVPLILRQWPGHSASEKRVLPAAGASASEKFSFWQKSHSQEPMELLWFSSCRAQAPLRNFSANLILNRHLKGIDENRFGSFHDDLVLGKGVFHRNENFFLAEAVRQASALAIRNSAAPAASSIHKQA